MGTACRPGTYGCPVPTHCATLDRRSLRCCSSARSAMTAILMLLMMPSTPLARGAAHNERWMPDQCLIQTYCHSASRGPHPCAGTDSHSLACSVAHQPPRSMRCSMRQAPASRPPHAHVWSSWSPWRQARARRARAGGPVECPQEMSPIRGWSNHWHGAVRGRQGGREGEGGGGPAIR